MAVTALAAAALAVGLYLNRPDAQDTASVSENSSQTVTYQGKTYRYNDHLSNFLFLGVDTRETLENRTAAQAARPARRMPSICFPGIGQRTPFRESLYRGIL